MPALMAIGMELTRLLWTSFADPWRDESSSMILTERVRGGDANCAGWEETLRIFDWGSWLC